MYCSDMILGRYITSSWTSDKSFLRILCFFYVEEHKFIVWRFQNHNILVGRCRKMCEKVDDIVEMYIKVLHEENNIPLFC